VTFKDLKKRISLQTSQQQSILFESLRYKLFWDIEEHKQEDVRTNGDCCFNHIIGLPQKDAGDKEIAAKLYNIQELERKEKQLKGKCKKLSKRLSKYKCAVPLTEEHFVSYSY
jgi:hypothetical protein